MTLKPQDTLAHYRLVEVVGEGGMGVVWKAEDTKLSRHVALKVLPPERVGDEERRLRFLREARTAAYMSPEQARGQPVDFRSDLFSFGVVLYEMVTGISPFRGDNVTDTLSSVVRDQPRDATEIAPEMPGELGRILHKCLDKDPAERFQNTADLTVDLRKLRRTTDSQPVTHVTDSEPIQAVPTPMWRRPPVFALAGATTILTGSLSQLGSRWILTGQLVDVASGKVLQSERIDGEDLYSMVDDLAGKIRADLVDAATAGTDRAVAERTTDSLEAYQAYIEGSELYARQAYSAADDKLIHALDLDPTFGQAQYLLAWSRLWRPQSDKERARELFEALLEPGAFKLPDKERLLTRAGLAFQKADWVEYARLGREAVALYPDEKDAWFVLGDALFHAPDDGADRRKDLDEEAVEMFDRALALDPAFEGAYDHFSQIFKRQGRWAELADRVQALVRREPENRAWYVGWAEALLRQADADGAEEVVQQALRHVQDPRDRPILLEELAMEFNQVSRRPRARELYNQALEIKAPEGSEHIHFGLGLIAERDRDLEEAEDQYRRALDLNPSVTPAFWNLARMLKGSGRLADLIRLCRSLTTRAPDHGAVYTYRMFAALLLGDEEEEELAFRTLENNKDSIAAWRQRADASSYVGNEVQALEYLEKAAGLIDLSPEGHYLHITEAYLPGEAAESYRAVLKSRSAVKLGRLEEAESTYRTFGELGSFASDEVRADLFRVLRDLGKTEEALLHAERWRKVQPRSNWSHAAVIEIHLMDGRNTEAERALQAGLEFHLLAQDKGDLLAGAAAAYRDAGQPERSEELIRQGIDLLGDDAADWVQERLIHALLHQQNYEEATQTLEQAMARRTGPPTGEQVWLLMHLALAREDADAAVRVALEQLPVFPGDRGTRWRAAVALTYQGDFARAEPLARQVIAMDPTFGPHELLAWILIAGEIDVDEGVVLAEKARTLPVHWSRPVSMAATPWRPSVEHALGLAYLKLGKPEEAIPWLEEAARLQPRRALVQEHLRQARR